MEKARAFFNSLLEKFSVVLMSVMVLLVMWQVISRYILNNPSSISEVLTRYLFVWLVTVTATYAFGKREHMYISLVKDRMPDKMQHIVNILIEALTLVFAAAVMVAGGCAITSMQMVQIDSTLHIATGIIYSVIPLCGVLIGFYCICNIGQELRKLQKKESLKETLQKNNSQGKGGKH